MLSRIKSLFTQAAKTRKQPHRKRRATSALLSLAILESRVMPVVGGAAPAAVVGPGTNMDGVVSLTTGNFSANASGSELADQRMILTAAHIVDTELFQLTVGVTAGGAGYSVGQIFTMPQGVGLGEVDTGGQPLSIRITGVTAPAGAITTVQVLNQGTPAIPGAPGTAGTPAVAPAYVAGAAGGLYVVDPPLTPTPGVAASNGSALLVAGFNNMGMPNPTTTATFNITSAVIAGSGINGAVGQVPVETVNFNLQNNGNPVNISIPIPGLAGPVQPGAANAIAGPAAGTFNNILTPAVGAMAWTGFAPGVFMGPNDIALAVLRDPSLAVTAGQNLEMVAPFSPFENGYPIIPMPAAPALGVANTNGPPFNVVGYGATGVGALGTVSASGVQQINLAGFVGGGGVNFTLTFNRPAIPGFPAALLPAVPVGGFTTAAINSTVGAGVFGPFRVAALIAQALNRVLPGAYGNVFPLGTGSNQIAAIVAPFGANTYIVRFTGVLANITVPLMVSATAGVGAIVQNALAAAAGVTPAQPAVGALPTKTRALNTYDQNVPPPAGAAVNGSWPAVFGAGGSVNVAEFDFDNGAPAQNIMGSAAGVAGEGIAGPGDSGGPGFTGTFQNGAASQLSIVGVQSFVGPFRFPAPTLVGWHGGAGIIQNFSFGNWEGQTLANNYLASLVTPAETAAYGIVIDMRYQVLGAAGQPQDPLTITVSRGNAAGVTVAGGLGNNPNLIISVTDALNAQYTGIYFNQPAASITQGVVLVGNGASDTFDIMGNLGVGPITIDGQVGRGIVNTVDYEDGANSVATTYQITAAAAAAPATPATTVLIATPTAGGTGQQVTASAFGTFIVDAGSGGNTINVQSTNSAQNLQINAGTSDWVNVGSPTNTLAPIAGAVSVFAASVLNVYDQGTAGPFTYTVSSTAVTRSDGVTVSDQCCAYVNILGASSGVNTYNVTGTPQGTNTTIYNGSNSDTVNVGDGNNTLDGILGDLSVFGAQNLLINDQGTFVGQTYTQTASSVTRQDIASIAWSAVAKLTVGVAAAAAAGPPPTNYVYVQGTSTTGDTTIDGGAGNDYFIVGSGTNPATRTLNDVVPYTLQINGGTGSNTLVVNDRGSTASRSYEVWRNYVGLANGSGAFFSGMESIRLLGGSGGNNIAVYATGADTTTWIDAGTGSNNATVGSPANPSNLSGILGNLNLDGQWQATPTTDNLVFNDSGLSPLPAYTQGRGSITRAGIGVIQYYNWSTVTFPPGARCVSWNPPAAIPYGTALGANQLDATATVAGNFSYTLADGTTPAYGEVLNAGWHTLDAIFTPTDTTDYSTVIYQVAIDVEQDTPTITWANPANITYGTGLGSTQLDATANVAGTFVYTLADGITNANGAVLSAGNGQTLNVTFTPTDATDYTTAAAQVQINVAQTTPTITWANPANITYGTALGSTQFDATANVAGTFVYTPTAGTLLGAGQNQTLNVTFTPTDTTDYTTATAQVEINVAQAAPTITWANPANITYGTALGSTQLDATANVAGTFVYTPAAGTLLGAGQNQTLNVTFTPTDTTDYTTATAQVQINVGQVTPTITWANPADITYGTALGSTQLDATANVAGTFVYTLANGTTNASGAVLSAGNGQTLNVTFTPTDTTDYTTATAQVQINVAQATPTITWANPANITYGTALGSTQLDATANVAGTFVYTPAAGTLLGAGQNQTLNVTFTPTDTTDYTTATAQSHINVAQATPTITWANPANITYGTALGSTQLDATANVAGTFVYTLANGTTNAGGAVLSAGNGQTLNAIFTPTDTTDYTMAEAQVQINVVQPAMVASVNSTTSNGDYGVGATITIEMNFTESVAVTGTPRLSLNSGGTANYTSGSGTATLTFTYTVSSGQSSSHLDYASTSALTLNGGTLDDTAGNNAVLTLPAPGATGSLGASTSFVISTTVPTVTSVASLSSNGSYKAGANIGISVMFSEAVVVTGTPQLALNSGGTAAYVGGSGGTTLDFSYTVASGNNSSHLDYASTSALTLNGGTLKDGFGNNAVLTLASPGATGSLGAGSSIVIDTTPPTVTGVSATTSNQSMGQARWSR